MYTNNKELYVVFLSFLRKKKVAIRDLHGSCECSLSGFLINCHIHKIWYVLPLYATQTSYFLIFYNE
jgi:hypothetical protein